MHTSWWFLLLACVCQNRNSLVPAHAKGMEDAFHNVWGRSCYRLPLEDEEAEAWRGEGPQVQSRSVAEPGFSSEGSPTSQPCSWGLRSLALSLCTRRLLLEHQVTSGSDLWPVASGLVGIFCPCQALSSRLLPWRIKEQEEVSHQSRRGERHRISPSCKVLFFFF